ncbi:MAG: PAS domain S-box protein [Terracidiphilus sp.]
MRNPSDNWEELRQKVLGLGDTSVRKTHYPSLKQRLAELEQMTRELQRSQAYLAEAQTLSHTGSFGWKPSTEEHIWSEETYRIFECDPAVKPSMDWILDRVHPEDRTFVSETLKRATETAQGFDYEHRLLMPDARVKFLHVLAKAMPDSSGGLEFAGAVTDITEARRAEEKIRQSEAELRELIDAIPQQVFVFAPDWSPLFANQKELEYTGLTPEEAQSKDAVAHVFHPEDLEKLQSARSRALFGRMPIEVEARIRRRDGEYRWFLIRDNPLRDEQGLVLRWYGTRTDIEDRMRAEQALRQSEERLRLTLESTQIGIFDWDIAHDVWYASPVYYTALGYEPRKGPGDRSEWIERLHPEDQDRVTRILQGVLAGETNRYEYEARLRHADGSYHWVQVKALGIEHDSDGKVSRELGVRIDITESKRAEEALRRSESYLADAQRLTHTGVWAGDRTSKPLYWSEEVFRIFGFDPQQGLPTGEQALARIHPEDFDKFQRSTINEKGYLESEYRIVLPDGTLKYVFGSAHPVLDRNGEIAEVVGVIVDITERKRAEEALRESETRFRTFVDHAADAFFMLDFEQGTILDVNRCACEDLGYTRQELIGKTPLEFDVNLDQATLESIAAQAADGGTVLFDRHWHRRKDGSLFPVEVHTSAFRHGGRRLLLKVARDITERLKAEEAIRQSEAELRQILDDAPQLLAVLGTDGTRLYLNQAALEYLGWTLEGSQNRPTSALFHPDDMKQVDGEVQQGFSTGSPIEVEARIPRHDGEYRWFLLHYKPLRDAHGRITRWTVAATDINDRKLEEERLQHENVALREEIDKASMFEEIVGSSPALRAALSRVAKVAPTDSTVLITGETGTGKELIARAIHKRSRRASRAFVSVNCAAIPRDLIASELFGHEKGAFTGATQRHLGRFELAEGGTIFLDEVGELPAETQVALLRVLQEREFERVGGDRTIRCDVRVIAATNRDVQAAIAAGTFRSDLFYRLNVFPIETPPLRKRKEDIPLLVEYFIDRYARKAGKSIRQVSKKTLELLQSYTWPGNIRELQNIVERSVIVCETESFSVDESWLSSQPLATEPGSQVGLSQLLATQEKETIEAALKECRGRVSGPSGAAARLSMPRSTLESKIRSLNIDKNRFKTQ